MKILLIILKLIVLLILPRKIIGGITVRLFNRKYHYYHPMEAPLKPDGEEYVQSIVFDSLICILVAYLIFGVVVDFGWLLHLNAVPFIGELIDHYCITDHLTPASFFVHGFEEHPVILFLYCVYIFIDVIDNIVGYNKLATRARNYLEDTQY